MMMMMTTMVVTLAANDDDGHQHDQLYIVTIGDFSVDVIVWILTSIVFRRFMITTIGLLVMTCLC